VSAIGIGQLSKSGAVEVDPAILDEIGVLSGNHAAGFEPDLPLVVVHPIDIAHQPVALGDLVFHLPVTPS
jgi:hypothetical protein